MADKPADSDYVYTGRIVVIGHGDYTQLNEEIGRYKPGEIRFGPPLNSKTGRLMGGLPPNYLGVYALESLVRSGDIPSQHEGLRVTLDKATQLILQSIVVQH